MSCTTKPTAFVTLAALTAAAAGQAAQPASPSPVLTAMNNLSTGGLVLTTNNQQQQIEIEIGPVPGEVRVFGISGIPDSPFVGVTSISLTTGSAQDYVEFRVFSAEAPSITLNTGRGNSDVKFIYATPAGQGPASSEVSVIGGSGEDKVAFEVISEAESFSASWDVRQAGANNEVTAVVASYNPSASLTVDLFSTAGAGQDKVDVNILSAAASTNINVAGQTGGGNDSAIVVIDEQAPGATNLTMGLNLGAGQDVAEILAVTRGGTAAFTGSVLGGADSDTLKSLLEGAGSSALTLNGGPGADYLDAEYKGAVSGAPRLLGGDGNDFLKIVAEQRALMTPFLNGGLGFDEAIGFGTIVNVEQIN
jgi:hypothetical protein